VAHKVTFEKKVGGDWKPIPSVELRAGDVTRMIENGAILTAEDGRTTEYRVAKLNGVDPDSHRSFDLGLEPIIT
jgi:hypothetical protein